LLKPLNALKIGRAMCFHFVRLFFMGIYCKLVMFNLEGIDSADD